MWESDLITSLISSDGYMVDVEEEFGTGDYKTEQIDCPVCQSKNGRSIVHILDIPYYDDYAMVNINCRDCGYRSTDFVNLKVKDHVKYTYHVSDEKDGHTKVVRAAEATVSIPELGVAIEPVGGSTWIRNLEGILEDIRTKMNISLEQSDDPENRSAIEQRLAFLEDLLAYRKDYTIVVDDPSGNSIILPAIESHLKKEIIEKVE